MPGGGSLIFFKMSARVADLPRTHDVAMAEGDVWHVAPAVVPQPELIPDSVALDLACATSDRATAIAKGVYTYQVTISINRDIDDRLVRWICKTYSDNNKFVVIEHGQSGKKYLHMLILFDQLKQKSDLRNVLLRNIKKYHPECDKKVNGENPALVVSTAYNLNWFNEYLRKEDDCIDVDTDNFDAERFRLALPDEATQNALQDAKRRRTPGVKWIDHEKRWTEYAPDDSSFESAIRYLNWRMCIQRDMEPIVNPTKLRQEAFFYTSIEISQLSRILVT